MRRAALWLAFATFTGGAAAQSYSGAELREALQLWSAVEAKKPTSAEERTKVFYAIGFIDGFSDAYLHEEVRGARLAKGDRYSFCLPKEFSNGDLRRSATAYLERRKQPHIDSAPASAVLAMAFHEIYPCKRR